MVQLETVVGDPQTCVMSSVHPKTNTSRPSRPRRLPITINWPQELYTYLISLPATPQEI